MGVAVSMVQHRRHSSSRTIIQRPAYLVESVDNAMRVLQILRDGGAVRLKEIANDLGVAPSTAHRLIATLVYRGYAVQDADRRYRAGPAMSAAPSTVAWSRTLVGRCRPHLRALSQLSGETVHLVIRVEKQARFLASVESTSQLFQVGDRSGQVLSAERTAAGRVLLADLPTDELLRLYFPEHAVGSVPDDLRLPSGADFGTLLDELNRARTLGFAINVEQSEAGVGAFAAPIRNRAGDAIAALAVAVPMIRYRRQATGCLISDLKSVVAHIEQETADIANSAEQNSVSPSAERA